MKPLLFALAVLVIPALALAQGVLPTPDDFSAFINLFLSSTLNIKVALALVAAVWAIRKYVVGKVPFFQTGEGGAVLLSITAFLLALSTSFYTLVGPMTWQWFGKVCFVAFAGAVTSAGTWNLIQTYVRLLAPKLIQGKVAKVPFIGVIVQKAAEYALKLVKSKLDKVAAGDVEAVVAPVPEPEVVDHVVDESHKAP